MRETSSKKTTISEASLETNLLFQHLKTIELGQTMTYEELNKVCGGDVQRDKYGCLATARRMYEREFPGQFLETVCKEGIKRVAPSAMTGFLDRKIQTVRKQSKRAVRRAMRVVVDDIPEGERAGFAARVSLLHLQSNMGKEKEMQQLEQLAGGEGGMLNQQKVLDVFKSK